MPSPCGRRLLARTVAAVRGYFDDEPGVLAFAAEVWRLDGRTGRPVLAEPLGPDLVEHGPVTLKIRMTMPTRTTSVSAAPAAARIAEVGKDLFRLGPRVLGDGVVQRVVPKQRGHVEGVRSVNTVVSASVSTTSFTAFWVRSAASMTFVPASASAASASTHPRSSMWLADCRCLPFIGAVEPECRTVPGFFAQRDRGIEHRRHLTPPTID
jgi:hypothetical protein